MNQKRRGRPTNAEVAVRNAGVEGADVPKAFFPEGEIRHDVMAMLVMTPSDIEPRAQAYALRVWNGQSASADRPWRVSRIKEALEAQGLSMDGVKLPD